MNCTHQPGVSRAALALSLGLVTLVGLYSMPASASTLAIQPGRVSAGAAALTACDPDGVQARFALNSAGRIELVAIHGIAVSCAGGTLKVTLAAASSSLGNGQATLPSGFGGGTVNVAVSGAAVPASVTSVHIAIEGP